MLKLGVYIWPFSLHSCILVRVGLAAIANRPLMCVMVQLQFRFISLAITVQGRCSWSVGTFPTHHDSETENPFICGSAVP